MSYRKCFICDQYVFRPGEDKHFHFWSVHSSELTKHVRKKPFNLCIIKLRFIVCQFSFPIIICRSNPQKRGKSQQNRGRNHWFLFFIRPGHRRPKVLVADLRRRVQIRGEGVSQKETSVFCQRPANLLFTVTGRKVCAES